MTDSAPTDSIRTHVRRVLEINLHVNQATAQRIEELERAGHRIVDGGQVEQSKWEICDWRTGEKIAVGDDGLPGYEAAADRLDPADTWIHIDHVHGDGESPEGVVTPGIPPTLAWAIQDWVEHPSTPEEEIAEFMDWPVEKVREFR